jgi:hypothetical protein
MNTKTKSTLYGLTLVLATACAAKENSAPVAQPAAANEDVEIDAEFDTVPTQADADATAAAEIDANNADAEFDKLKEEI